MAKRKHSKRKTVKYKESKEFNQAKTKKPIEYIMEGIIIIVIPLSALIATAYSSQKWHENLTSTIKEQKYDIVEGKVKNFIPMNGVTQKSEQFSVNDVHFTMGTCGDGYNHPKSKGGVIDKGKSVRIHHYRGCILRLWVWEKKKK